MIKVSTEQEHPLLFPSGRCHVNECLQINSLCWGTSLKLREKTSPGVCNVSCQACLPSCKFVKSNPHVLCFLLLETHNLVIHQSHDCLEPSCSLFSLCLQLNQKANFKSHNHVSKSTQNRKCSEVDLPPYTQFLLPQPYQIVLASVCHWKQNAYICIWRPISLVKIKFMC